jgi:hypothetical protein
MLLIAHFALLLILLSDPVDAQWDGAINAITKLCGSAGMDCP